MNLIEASIEGLKSAAISVAQANRETRLHKVLMSELKGKLSNSRPPRMRRLSR
jgi:hypothetical protein